MLLGASPEMEHKVKLSTLRMIVLLVRVFMKICMVGRLGCRAARLNWSNFGEGGLGLLWNA